MSNTGGARFSAGAFAPSGLVASHGFTGTSVLANFATLRIVIGSRPEAGYASHCDLPLSASCRYCKFSASGEVSEYGATTSAAAVAITATAKVTTENFQRPTETAPVNGASGRATNATQTVMPARKVPPSRAYRNQ